MDVKDANEEVKVKVIEANEEVKEVKVEKYIESFNSLEKIAYEIAKTRLKTSFDIEKSIGFNRN